MLFLSFQASLSPFTSSRPIFLFHELMIHHSCRLALMVFSLICQTFAALVARLSTFHLDPQKWPLTFSPLNIWSIPTVHMWIKDLSVFPTYLLSFPSRAFWTVNPSIYIYIYIFFFFFPFLFFSYREQCCLWPRKVSSRSGAKADREERRKASSAPTLMKTRVGRSSIHPTGGVDNEATFTTFSLELTLF